MTKAKSNRKAVEPKSLFVAFKTSPNNQFQSYNFDFDLDKLLNPPQKPEIKKQDHAAINPAKSDENPFVVAIDLFVGEMNAYLQGTHIVQLALPAFSSVAIQRNPHKFAKDKGKKIQHASGEIYELKMEHVSRFLDASRKSSQWMSYLGFLPRMTLLSVVSSFDGYLANLLFALFSEVPGLLNSSEKKLSVADVVIHDSISDLKSQLIKKEVETLLRDSHEDHFKWIEDKLKVPLRKDLKIWPRFIEVCERRNLITHSNGVVSQQYLANCKSAGHVLDPSIEIGSKLIVDILYLQQAAEVFYEIGVKLGHVIWRKVRKSDDQPLPERSYSNICFEIIKAENYKLANSLLEFGTAMPNLDDEYHRVMTINFANSTKLSGNFAGAEKILDSFNWKTSGLEYKICAAAIRRKHDEVYTLMQKIGKKGEISKEGYLTWPVFREVRKEQKFKEIYKKIFGTPYDTDELQLDSSEKTSA